MSTVVLFAEYSENVLVTVFVKFDLLDKFLKDVQEATNATVHPEIVGEIYVDKIISDGF